VVRKPSGGPSRPILALILLSVLTLATLWPVVRSEFVAFDDPVYILQNPQVMAGLTWSGIGWALTSGYAANWHPLTWVSHMADVSLFGMGPAGHHATSLVLHTLATILVFLVFRRLTGSVGRSGWVAALFAVHPAHVESVAWVAERKDVLSAVFWFAAIGAYAAWTRKGSARRYALVALLFAGGLMSKPMVVTLPVVLLLLDYWPLARFAPDDGARTTKQLLKNRIVEKLPLFGMSAMSAYVTVAVQRAGGAVGSLEEFPLDVRIGNAVVAFTHYLRVLFWPTRLAVFYPHPKSIALEVVAAAAILFAVVTVGAILLRRRAPFAFVGWCWFVVTLLPVIGLVQVGKQSAADRYTYIPFVGLFVVLAWGVPALLARGRFARPALRVAAAASVLACAAGAASQVRLWKNSETLLSSAIQRTSNNDVALMNLSNYYNTLGKPAEALPLLEDLLRLRPRDHAVFVNIGHSLFLMGRLDEAARNFSAALQLDRTDSVALIDLARVRFLQGDVEESIRLYRAGIASDPGTPDPRKRLALALLMEGDAAGAVRELERAVSRFPQDDEARAFLVAARAFTRNPGDPACARLRGVIAAAHRDSGIALGQRGRIAEAARQYDRAVQLFPDDTSTRINRGALFFQIGRLDDAALEFREAIRVDPGSALAHTNLGYIFYLQGRRDEAIAEYREALRLQPGFPLAAANLELALKGQPSP
jgi:tetratricopeptide (TPR) repeat protein